MLKLRKEITKTSGGVSRGGLQRRNTERVTDMGQLELLTIQVAEAKSELKIIKKTHSVAKKDLDELVKSHEDWKLEFMHRTHDTLLQHGKQVLQPAFGYYKKLFIEDGGDCCHMSKMAEACEIFNPILLKDISETEIVTVLHYMADKLIHFKYTEIFTEDFIRRLKKEMPGVVEAAKPNHNLDNIKGSRQYYIRMQQKMKRHNILGRQSNPFQIH